MYVRVVVAEIVNYDVSYDCELLNTANGKDEDVLQLELKLIVIFIPYDACVRLSSHCK